MQPDVPRRDDGVELIGELEGSGYRTPPALVRRRDGQTLQLTPLVYAVLSAVDGVRTYTEIAQRVASETGRAVSASNVAALIDAHLRPKGLVLQLDGSSADLRRANPLLALRLKVAVTDPRLTRRLTDPFARLFHPLVWIPIVIAFAVLAWWLLMDHGLAAATYQAFAKPSLLVVVLAITVLSAGFHEFGHAAAARRGGAQPGVIGAGLYLLWPAFYTDVTDTYRLGRIARLRTDLGGLYFNAIVAVAIAGVWWISRWDALLLVIATQILQMVRQLAPLVRFDGYHVLADLVGVPDLYSRVVPILTSMWPTRWRDPRVTQLRWWARVVVTAWVVIVVPLLLFTLGTIVLAVPRIIGTAAESAVRERDRMTQLWSSGQPLDAIGAGIALLAISVPVGATAVLLFRVVSRALRTLWRKTAGRPVRRAAASGLVVALTAAVVFAWLPFGDRYRPIRPFEGGTLNDLVSVAPGDGQGSASANSAGGEITTVLPASYHLSDDSEPRMALVLVPKPGASDPADPTWVFPFDRPLPPGTGDNQALAVNTENGSAAYEVAVAMVWVTGADAVLNTNEAYAFASCADCVTVAVAFQVVVIVGRANVIVPQNVSAAVNYGCFDCITAAVASQLVVTIDSAPGAEEQIALADVWDDITAYAASIPTLPLADVIAQLDAYKAQIEAILGVAPPPPAPTSPPAGASSFPEATDLGSPNPSLTVVPTQANPSPDLTPTSPVSGSPPSSGAPEPTPSATPAAAASSQPSPPAP